jgi:hypothetical protein
MERLTAQWEEQFAESGRLEAVFREKLAWLWRSGGS